MKIIILFVLFIKHALSSSLDSSLAARECNYCSYESCTSTVFPASRFDAKDDAKLLEAAIMTNGGQEDTIATILTSRSDVQRVKISEEYISTGRTLIDDLKRGVKSDGLSILEGLTKPLPMFLADEIHDALLSCDYEALNEIFVSLPNCAIREVSVYYRLAYKTSLIDSINAHRWFNYKAFLLELAKANRDESDEVSEDDAKKTAQTLVGYLPSLWRWNRPTKFIEVFTRTSFAQLKIIFKHYDKIRKNNDPSYKSLVKDLTDYFGTYLADGLVAIVRNAQDQRRFFISQLHLAFLKYSDPRYKRTVNRIIRSRCELDLEDIKDRYEKIYLVSLLQSIRNVHVSVTRKAFYAVLNEIYVPTIVH